MLYSMCDISLNFSDINSNTWTKDMYEPITIGLDFSLYWIWTEMLSIREGTSSNPIESQFTYSDV